MADDDPTALETFADSRLEIDHGGDYIIDTTEALGGDVYVKLSESRAFSVEVDGQTVFEVRDFPKKRRAEKLPRGSECDL